MKLTIDGHEFTAPLSIKMDPRVKASSADLQQQADAGKQLARFMTHTSEAIREARSAQEQIDKLAHATAGPMAARLADLGKKIQAVLGTGGTSGLMSVNGEASGLYGEIDSADAAPTAAQSAGLDRNRRRRRRNRGGWSLSKRNRDI